MLNYFFGLGKTIQFNYATKEIREFLYRNYEGYDEAFPFKNLPKFRRKILLQTSL